jgi:hypothetical protein
MLIKSTLSNLLTNFLSLFPIPVGVANRLEKLIRDFLLSTLDNKPKFHLVNWKKVCAPIQFGGLGVKILTTFNQAVLGKWLWGFAAERERSFGVRLWIRCMGVWRGWHTRGVTGAMGCVFGNILGDAGMFSTILLE